MKSKPISIWKKAPPKNPQIVNILRKIATDSVTDRQLKREFSIHVSRVELEF